MIKNKVLGGWIMAGHHLVKGSKWLLRTCNNNNLWKKLFIIFSIGATLDHLLILLLSLFSFRVLCPPSCKRKVWQPCIQGVAKDWG